MHGTNSTLLWSHYIETNIGVFTLNRDLYISEISLYDILNLHIRSSIGLCFDMHYESQARRKLDRLKFSTFYLPGMGKLLSS